MTSAARVWREHQLQRQDSTCGEAVNSRLVDDPVHGNHAVHKRTSRSYPVTERCSSRILRNARLSQRFEQEFVIGGRRWTRTSGLLHVKHFRLSAVLGAWEAKRK
jgi:hypothetical protein